MNATFQIIQVWRTSAGFTAGPVPTAREGHEDLSVRTFRGDCGLIRRSSRDFEGQARASEGPLVSHASSIDPKRWRERAAKMRALAEATKSPEAARVTLKVAEYYETVADQEEFFRADSEA
jgi:hypothetical protein